MLRAAILARKSTDDDDRVADNKSVSRQVARGRDFIQSRGWSLDDAHIFVDDDISGAEFKHRPGLLRLLNHLRDFDVIVMSEQSRLGREQSYLGAVLAQIRAADVRVFFYLTESEAQFDSAIDKFMVSAVAFSDELEREKASQRARDALAIKAAKGYNTGGRVYGYDNVPVIAKSVNGEAVRSHTDYRINAAEADVVRGIFQARADGRGLRAIARALNGDPALHDIRARYFNGQSPPPPRKGTGSWAPSSVREILHRERYRGIVPFGRHKKVVRGGTTRGRILQSEYIRTDRPDLRIVPDELWDRTSLCIAQSAGAHHWQGNRAAESRYLLSGIMRCKSCGGAMVATSWAHGTGKTRRRIMRYACAYAKNRGPTVCGNSQRPRMDIVDAQIIDAIQSDILSPAAIRRTIELVLDRAKDERKASTSKSIDQSAELQRLRREIDRLVSLVVAGGKNDPPARILSEIKTRENRIADIERSMAQSRTLSTIEGIDPKKIESAAADRLLSIGSTLSRNTATARQALMELLVGPVWFHALDGREYRLEGATNLGALLNQKTCLEVASPRGFAQWAGLIDMPFLVYCRRAA